MERSMTLVALVLLVAACTGDPGADPPGSLGGTEPPLAASDGGHRDPVTPLWEFLGVADLGVSPTANEDAITDARRVQELIADCMRAEGFDYVPLEPLSTVAVGDASHPWNLPDEEFVATHGYGITTLDGAGASDRPADPNDELLEGMSDAEREAWYDALWGEGSRVFGGSGATVSVLWESPAGGPTELGCHQRATAEVSGIDPAGDTKSSFDEFGGLLDAMGMLWQRIDKDPRVVAAVDHWSSCMADAGYPGLATPSDGQGEVIRRLRDLVDVPDQATAGDLPPPGELGANEALVDKRGAFLEFGDGSDLSDVDPAALQELRAFEIAIAAADHRCRQHHDTVRLQVQVELEREFIRDHRAELERYRDALATSPVAG